MMAALSTPWVAHYIRHASRVAWAFHDEVLQRVFGCGVSKSVCFADVIVEEKKKAM